MRKQKGDAVAHLATENLHIWYDENLLSANLDACFDIAFWQQQECVLGKAKGRGITWFVQTPSLSAALRHYCRGGLIGKLVKESYLFTGFANTRPAREFALLAYLHQQGIAVPRPIAARALRKGLIYRADILVEKIEGARSLVDILKTERLTLQHYQQIGQLIAQLHAAQVCHTDLNIHNILRDNNGKFWLIDFDNCAKKTGNHWQRVNLKRLLRSFHKERKRADILWQQSDWQALVAGYTLHP